VIVQTQIEGTRLAGNLLGDPIERDRFEAGIPHEHREHPGNHGGPASERFQVTLEWLSQTLDGDLP
jgi:hypothetical protein